MENKMVFINENDIFLRSPHSLDSIDFDAFFTLIEYLGDSLNARKNRFDKADFIELAMEIYSDGSLVWVDAVGHDHVCSASKTKFEVKSQKNCLYTKKGNLKKKTSKIKISNSLSQDLEREFTSDFDYLVIVDTGFSESYSMAYIEIEKVKPYLHRIKDGWDAQIPIKDLVFVCSPGDFNISSTDSVESYSEAKSTIQRKIIESIRSLNEN